MMYEDKYSDEIVKKLAKLKKKDTNHYYIIRKKMDWILENPKHNYKFLSHDMKGMQRIHIGPFVLTFVIDHHDKIISFEDYDHHDNIYNKKCE